MAAITPIPTPYRDPFWSEVGRRDEIDLTVYYCSAGKSDRPWETAWDRGFRYEVLRGWNLLRWRGGGASCFWNPGIISRLRNGDFDALVIGGYNHLTMLAAMRYAVRNDLPYYIMCESHLRSRRPRWTRTLKGQLVRRVVREAAGGFPAGTLAEEYLVHYGARSQELVKLPNVPDVKGLAEEAATLREQRRFPGPPVFAGRPVVLFVGRLIPKKRAELVIRALQRVRRRQDAVLVIVGDGPSRQDLEKLAENLGVRPHVHFAGFVQPDEVTRWYASASVFVLPSSETWGVAAVEAVACGVPVVVADEVGCHPDIVVNREIGTVVPAGDVGSIAEALQDRLRRRSPAAAGDLVRDRLLQTLQYDVLVERFIDAIRLLRTTPDENSRTDRNPPGILLTTTHAIG